MMIAILILLGLFAGFFVWCLCRISAISDRRMEEMVQRMKK
jgi:hypothetical protein